MAATAPMMIIAAASSYVRDAAISASHVTQPCSGWKGTWVPSGYVQHVRREPAESGAGPGRIAQAGVRGRVLVEYPVSSRRCAGSSRPSSRIRAARTRNVGYQHVEEIEMDVPLRKGLPEQIRGGVGIQPLVRIRHGGDGGGRRRDGGSYRNSGAIGSCARKCLVGSEVRTRRLRENGGGFSACGHAAGRRVHSSLQVHAVSQVPPPPRFVRSGHHQVRRSFDVVPTPAAETYQFPKR